MVQTTRFTNLVADKEVDIGDLAEPVIRYRFEHWINAEAEAVRRILVVGLRAEGFIGHE